VAITDYAASSMTQILDEHKVECLISFFSSFDNDEFARVHNDLMDACIQSKSCKQFAPSEWAGNARDYPEIPGFYYSSRGPIRARLAAQTEIQWMTICLGIFSDYMLVQDKTYLKNYDSMNPWDRRSTYATLAGTGTEPVGTTGCRDVMKAAVRMATLPQWDVSSSIFCLFSLWARLVRFSTQCQLTRPRPSGPLHLHLRRRDDSP
jgi:hypothetical protein